MCNIYVTEHGCQLGIKGGNLYIKHLDSTVDNIPKNTIEGISIFSKSSMTTQCIEYCLENNIRVSFFTSAGRYYGSLITASPDSVTRLRGQFKYTDDVDFSLIMSKKFIYAKIHNQIVVASRYIKNTNIAANHSLYLLRKIIRKIPECTSKKALMGYEGLASRLYFDVLSKIIVEGFQFDHRTRRPAADPFNTMLNIGYSLLTKEINGELINRCVSPYIGFMHSGHDKSPALTCDLIEEWRPVIVDSVVLSLIQGHEISPEMFEYKETKCLIDPSGFTIMLAKLEAKMRTENRYLSYINKPLTFRAALWHQAEKIGRVFDTGNTQLYSPVIIR